MPGLGQLSLGLARGLTHFKQSESQIETAICHYLRIKGYFFYKQPNAGYFSGKQQNGQWIGSFRRHASPYVRRGVPDIILIINGRAIGIEVKSATGKQSEEQVELQKDWEKAGGLYFVVRKIEDVENALRKI